MVQKGRLHDKSSIQSLPRYVVERKRILSQLTVMRGHCQCTLQVGWPATGDAINQFFLILIGCRNTFLPAAYIPCITYHCVTHSKSGVHGDWLPYLTNVSKMRTKGLSSPEICFWLLNAQYATLMVLLESPSKSKHTKVGVTKHVISSSNIAGFFHSQPT
jgi:hypothetical protein